MKNPVTGAFRALSSFNYRVWAAGALVSNIGTWMQRIAQDWLVLDATDASRCLGGWDCDGFAVWPATCCCCRGQGWRRTGFNQRKLLMFTQATMGVLALILGVMTIEGVTRLWHVYVFCVSVWIGCGAGCAGAADVCRGAGGG